LKGFLEAVHSAKDIRQYAIQKTEPYKGSQAYDHMIESATISTAPTFQAFVKPPSQW
jgi:hypothetical protein